MPSRSRRLRQTKRPPEPWELTKTVGGTGMHPDDLMKPDLLSEILLSCGGGLALFSLLLILATLARS